MEVPVPQTLTDLELVYMLFSLSDGSYPLLEVYMMMMINWAFLEHDEEWWQRIMLHFSFFELAQSMLTRNDSQKNIRKQLLPHMRPIIILSQGRTAGLALQLINGSSAGSNPAAAAAKNP